MEPRILSPQDADEFYFQEGCYILELANSPQDPSASVARARVMPGVATRWHHLQGISERYVILQGSGRVEIGDLQPQRVAPGDVVVIPPQMRQRIINTGVNDLIFLAICTPRFEPQAYVDLQPQRNQ